MDVGHRAYPAQLHHEYVLVCNMIIPKCNDKLTKVCMMYASNS